MPLLACTLCTYYCASLKSLLERLAKLQIKHDCILYISTQRSRVYSWESELRRRGGDGGGGERGRGRAGERERERETEEGERTASFT